MYANTISSFFRIGKKTVLKTLQDSIDEFADLNKLCLLDSETSIDVSRNFVARLYDQKGKMKDVVSQPIKACTAGNNLHTRGPWIWQISWTGR
jgi:hypothetical protein